MCVTLYSKREKTSNCNDNSCTNKLENIKMDRLTDSNDRRQRHGSGDRNNDYGEQQCHCVQRGGGQFSLSGGYGIVRADSPRFKVR